MNNKTLRAALRNNIALSEASDASLSGFLDEYFGTAQDTPFGGREREFLALAAWLSDPNHPFALVVSEAGKGKSALLTRWAASVAARHVRVAFAPVSIRFGTSLRGAALRLLAQQLAALTGQKLSETRHAEAVRTDCETMLSAKHDKPLLVVIDGVDEATGWQVGEDLDLSAAGANCKILLSARSSAAVDASAWIQKLKLDPVRTTLFLISGLRQESVSSLVGELQPLHDKPNASLAEAVYRLSEGDPLLVRLYLEFLRNSPDHLENLPQTPPGLEGWFSLWWTQLRSRWTGNPIMEPLAEDIFDLLATSLGPLPRKTLLRLLRSQHQDPDVEPRMNFLLNDIRPLLLGDGEKVPFVLSHPRLRYFRQEQMSPEKSERLNQRFVLAGQTDLEALQQGRLASAQVSSYILRYLGAHVEASPNPFDSLEKLICPAWQMAWEALEGTYDGFLEDVDRAWKHAENVARTDPSRQAISLALVARCALLFSSVSSLVYSLPPNLAGHLVEQGIWSPAVALSQARWPSGGYRSETLVSLAPFLDVPLIRRALTEATKTQYIRDLNDVEGIAVLLGRMVALGAADEVEKFVEAFPSQAVRALIGAVSWPHLPKEFQHLAARWVVLGADQVDHCSYAAATVFAALPILERDKRQRMIDSALHRLWDEDFGLDTEHAAFLAAAGEWSHGWQEAMNQSMGYPAMNSFAAIAPYLPDDKKAIAYDKWLVAAKEILNERFSMLSMVIPTGLSQEKLAQILEVIRSKPDDRGAAKPLVVLSYEHPELRAEALAAVEKLKGPHGAIGRLALAPVMDPGIANRLALEAYRLMLYEIDHGNASDTWNADASWPRGPGHRHWCYIGDRRYPPVLVVECLRWMHPEEKARCVRELLARFRRIADNDAILATAATLAEELPKESKNGWAEKLILKRKGETIAITLAALGELFESEQRHSLAVEAWKGSVETDTEGMAGEALARASAWLSEDERETLQIAAIDRWTSGPKKVNASNLAQTIGQGLTRGAARHLLDKDEHGWVLEALVPVIWQYDQQRVEKWLKESLRDLHQIPWTLQTLYRFAKNPGPIVAAYLKKEHSWPHFRDERALAVSLWPLYMSGHVDLAETQRKQLTTELGKRIANLAYARWKKEGHIEALRKVLTPLENDGSGYSLLVDAAEELYAPLGYLPQIVELARKTEALWLATLTCLQKFGHVDILRKELTAERIELHRMSIFHLIDAELWVKQAKPSTLTEMWLEYWRQMRTKPRRKALVGDGKRWFASCAALISTLGGKEATEAVLREVLLVGEWIA